MRPTHLLTTSSDNFDIFNPTIQNYVHEAIILNLMRKPNYLSFQLNGSIYQSYAACATRTLEPDSTFEETAQYKIMTACLTTTVLNIVTTWFDREPGNTCWKTYPVSQRRIYIPMFARFTLVIVFLTRKTTVMRGLGNAEALTFAFSHRRAQFMSNLSSDGRNLDLFALELRVWPFLPAPVARQVFTWNYRCYICHASSHRNVRSRSDCSISWIFANSNRRLYFSLCSLRSRRSNQVSLKGLGWYHHPNSWSRMIHYLTFHQNFWALLPIHLLELMGIFFFWFPRRP